MANYVTIIIGANYGDEGKGLMTDYFCRRYGPPKCILNTRFNGGAQAGHTVITPDSVRHVFSHFGSGTLAGVRTFLTKDFIVNPVLFVREHKQLLKLGVDPTVYIDCSCRVTTIFDMLLNQLRFTGGGLNNTCGLGVYDTIIRDKAGLRLTVGDLQNHDKVYLDNFLRRMLNEYVSCFVEKFGVKSIPTDIFKAFMQSEGLIHSYLEDVDYMLEHCNVEYEENELYKVYPDYLVFEGAQGLGLGMDSNEDKEFLTPSNTGIKNAFEEMARMNVAKDSEVEIIYVSRNYVTRHGMGPLNHELNGRPYVGLVDLTNVANPYQGYLRYAYLDLDELYERIRNDVNSVDIPSGYKITISGAVTCMDQIPRDKLIRVIDGGKRYDWAPAFFIERYKQKMSNLGMTKTYFSYGPTCKTVEYHNK